MQSRCARGPGKQVTIALGWDCTQMEKGLNLFLHHFWCRLFPLQTMKKMKWINLYIIQSCWMDGLLAISEMSVKWKKPGIILPSWPCVWPFVCRTYVFQFHATWQDHKCIWMCACHIPRRVSFLRILITAITDSSREMSSTLKGIGLCALLPFRWEGFWITSTVISSDCAAVGAALKSHCACQSSVLTDRVRMDVKQNRATDRGGTWGIPESVTGRKLRSFVISSTVLVMTLWFVCETSRKNETYRVGC